VNNKQAEKKAKKAQEKADREAKKAQEKANREAKKANRRANQRPGLLEDTNPLTPWLYRAKKEEPGRTT
jgi:hypothetical protein